MHGKSLVVILVLIVLAGIIFPFAYSRMAKGAPPVLAPPPGGQKQCVEPIEYMRKHHVDLLLKWRDEAVRDNIHTYTSTTGKTYDIGLTSTCLSCHSNKAEFCDRCHNYLKVEPKCFDCHNVPPEGGAR